MPSSCYWIVIGLSAGASNFTNGAINTHNRISGTIRTAIKNCWAKTRSTGGEEKEGVEGGVKKKIWQKKEMKSVSVREWNGEGGQEDGGPLFISVPPALLGIYVLRFQPKCNLSPGLIQSVCSSSVQTQSLTLTCNPFPHHHQRCFGNNETHLSNTQQSYSCERGRILMRCLVTLMKGVLTCQWR